MQNPTDEYLRVNFVNSVFYPKKEYCEYASAYDEYMAAHSDLPNNSSEKLSKEYEKLLEERKKLDEEHFGPNSKPIYVTEPMIIPTDSEMNTSKNPTQNYPINTNNITMSMDNINTSFRVITNLQEGVKLRVVDNSYLAADSTLFYALRNAKKGQSRAAIIEFLDNLFQQTVICVDHLIESNNTSHLATFMHNFSTFMHAFDKLKHTYKDDSNTCAKLDNIYSNFSGFYSMIFQRILSRNGVIFPL